MALLVVVAVPAQAEWGVDASHTEVNFSIKHFFTPTTGNFSDFDIEMKYDPANPGQSSVKAKIAVASIDTGNEKRDGHVVSADFFDAENHPYITFESRSVAKTADGLLAKGTLTIKGVAKDFDLPITLLGTKEIPAEMQEMFGGSKEVASFQVSTTLDRNDYGVGVGNWAATAVIGGEVKIDILLEAHRK